MRVRVRVQKTKKSAEVKERPGVTLLKVMRGAWAGALRSVYVCKGEGKMRGWSRSRMKRNAKRRCTGEREKREQRTEWEAKRERWTRELKKQSKSWAEACRR